MMISKIIIKRLEPDDILSISERGTYVKTLSNS